MLALYVDYNTLDWWPEGGNAVYINLVPPVNPLELAQFMREGDRVIVYDSEMRDEAILHRNKYGWVAVLIDGTSRGLQPGELERLEAATSAPRDFNECN